MHWCVYDCIQLYTQSIPRGNLWQVSNMRSICNCVHIHVYVCFYQANRYNSFLFFIQMVYITLFPCNFFLTEILWPFQNSRKKKHIKSMNVHRCIEKTIKFENSIQWTGKLILLAQLLNKSGANMTSSQGEYRIRKMLNWKIDEKQNPILFSVKLFGFILSKTLFSF